MSHHPDPAPAAVATARPYVTYKFAATLDGRSAAADGSSRWVSSLAARRDTHHLRAEADTMLVGSNTVALNDPLLTVRDEDDRPYPDQPLRVVMGLRHLDPASRILDPAHGPSLQLRVRDPEAALAELGERGSRHVFLEGGPRLGAAFLRAGLVDRLVVHLAPMLLGSGANAVADLGIGTIAAAMRPTVESITTLEPVADDDPPNLRLVLTPQTAGPDRPDRTDRDRAEPPLDRTERDREPREQKESR